MGTYVPNTGEEQKRMLESCGFSSFEEMYACIPEALKLKRPLDLPAGKAEMEVRRVLEAMAARNRVYPTLFRGAGAYRHFIPAIVKEVAGKEEFRTAYTPYQAEISQGVLQSIFEFQTDICELTGLAAANASVYDGATAAAEACDMCRDKKRAKALVSAAADPKIISVIRTYGFGRGAEIVCVPEKDGATDLDSLKKLIDDETACVFIQQPNYFGCMEDADAVAAIAHESKAKLVMSCNPIALAVMKTPGEIGADIAVGEGQPLGLPLGFGGPYLGFMAADEKMMRKLPGRIVGETTDMNGNRCFVLTLQAREQHIRREKAGSNICSNEALCALTAGVYLAAMGPEGLRKTALSCHAKAAFLLEQLAESGLKPVHHRPFFHEFVTKAPDEAAAQAVLAALDRQDILGGLPLGEGRLLWCATEMNTREEIERTARIVKEALKA
ncbi:MAG: aminomethyl-transferring glycine dehydrogenase subunit GcvPA [Clostridia bacterium]|nr:aminomethyl-transferring glycine dehydrogenase subunit GcvPA [Clostridia bacterium]